MRLYSAGFEKVLNELRSMQYQMSNGHMFYFTKRRSVDMINLILLTTKTVL